MGPVSPAGQVEDEEKAAMRRQILQLEQAAAAQASLELSNQLAAQSRVTEEERLEAALQQQQLHVRIQQLEVSPSGSWLQFCAPHLPLGLCSQCKD